MLIEIKNSEIFEKDKIDFASQFNIIFGENASGKTFILREIINSTSFENYDNINNLYLCYIPIKRIPNESETNALDVNNRLSTYESLQKQKGKGKRTETDEYYIGMKNYVLLNDDNLFLLNNIVSKIFNVKFIYDKSYYDKYSDGYKSILNIFSELIYYKNLADQTGKHCLFLIDEIDLYIHMSAQSRIYQQLEENFPNSTFILTTHSPILVRSFKNTSIFEINENRIETRKNAYLKQYREIISSYFDVEEYPKNISGTLDELGKLVSDFKYRDKMSKESKCKLKNDVIYIKENYESVYDLYKAYIEVCLDLLKNV